MKIAVIIFKKIETGFVTIEIQTPDNPNPQTLRFQCGDSLTLDLPLHAEAEGIEKADGHYMPESWRAA